MAAFTAAVVATMLRHLADPLLVRALKGAVRRDIGDGLWAWSRRKSLTAISPLVAVTIALWGLSVVEPKTPPPAAPVVIDGAAGWSETADLTSAGF